MFLYCNVYLGGTGHNIDEMAITLQKQLQAFRTVANYNPDQTNMYKLLIFLITISDVSC